MLAFITDVYSKFLTLMTSWRGWQIVLFALVVPILALVIQIFSYSSRFVYGRALARLRKFFKHNSYLRSSTAFSFNKKVVKVFPKNIRRQTKHIADNAMPIEEFLNTFSFCYDVKKNSVVSPLAFAHTILLGIIVAMNVGSVSVVSASVIAIAAVWLAVKFIDKIIFALFSAVDKAYRKRFLVKLDSNTVTKEKEVDLTIPKEEPDIDDSALELAKSVEDFLAGEPDKSIAKVVLKGLYSAKFSSAMNTQTESRLKNVVVELKNYVG